MEHLGDRLVTININKLNFSQIYLSSEKIENIEKWFKKSLENFEPISVRDFLSNGKLVVTDGHSRTFVAWKNGIVDIPVVYDESEIVTNQIGHEQYINDILWCERYKIYHISDLENRVLPKEMYDELWQNRCEKMYNLVLALNSKSMNELEFMKKKSSLEKQKLFIYGISNDLATIYYEDENGKLYEKKYLEV